MSATAVLRGAVGRTAVPRALHPLAWWLWAIGLAVATSQTTNPLLLLVVLGVTCCVVAARRPAAPWARAFRFYLIGGALIVLIRMIFRVVFAGGAPGFVLLPLPTVRLPSSVGLQLFGDVTAESLLAGCYDGLRLATLLICLGAANALANPRRLLRLLPAALSEVSTAVVVALSVFPQLAESVVRVSRARRLRRGEQVGRWAVVRRVAVPVLEDALDRSLLLAASMDARGYGRAGERSAAIRRLSGFLLVAGLCGMGIGAYGVLDSTTPRLLGMPLLAGGALLGACGVVASGAGVSTTTYRPDPWRLPELLVVVCGVVPAAVLVAGDVSYAVLYPPLTPLGWPSMALAPLLAVLVGVLPAVLSPAPPALETEPA